MDDVVSCLFVCLFYVYSISFGVVLLAKGLDCVTLKNETNEVTALVVAKTYTIYILKFTTLSVQCIPFRQSIYL